MRGIKRWFLKKHNFSDEAITVLQQDGYRITAETQKAALIEYHIYGFVRTLWVPKSCFCDSWEKDTSGLGYHHYLVDLYHKAYDEDLLGDKFFIEKNGSIFKGDAFVDYWKTADIISELQNHNVDFLSMETWMCA